MKEESNYTKSDYIDITKNRTFREWGISLVLLISLTSYVAIFWRAWLSFFRHPIINRLLYMNL